jgi:gamma-glutamyltranspeptidase/glutathione hydrolase/leukotriene-C4 hydrolase
VESTYRPDLLEALTSRGHNVSLFDISVGIAEVQAVLRMPDGKLFGESRR